MITIEYGEKVVVGTIACGKFRWLVCHKDVWVLDYDKWSASFADSNMGDLAQSRDDIAVLDLNSFTRLLEMNPNYVVPCEILEGILGSNLRPQYVEDVVEYLPSLYVNFDNKLLLSNFYEPLSFEAYVPDGWRAEHKLFTSLIPEEEVYWGLIDRSKGTFKDYQHFLG